MSAYTGSCHCGQCHYSVDQNSDFQFTCYCNDCKKLNGAGHLCGLLFDDSQLNSEGDTKTYTYNGGNAPIVLHFCPNCSTQLYAYPTAYPNKVVIRANSLDQGDFKPQQDLFQESAFSWDKAANA